MLWTAILVISAALHVESLVAMNQEFIDLDTMSLVSKFVYEDSFDVIAELFKFLRPLQKLFQRWIPFFKEYHAEEKAGSTQVFYRRPLVLQEQKKNPVLFSCDKMEMKIKGIYYIVSRADHIFPSVDTQFDCLELCGYSCFMCGKRNTKMTRNFTIFTRMDTIVKLANQDKHVTDSFQIAENSKACYSITTLCDRNNLIFNSYYTHKADIMIVYCYHNCYVDTCKLCIDLHTNEGWWKDLDFHSAVIPSWITSCFSISMIQSVNMILFESVLIEKYSGVFQPVIVYLSVYLNSFSSIQRLFRPQLIFMEKGMIYQWKLTDDDLKNSGELTKFTNPRLHCLMWSMYPCLHCLMWSMYPWYWNIPYCFHIRPNFPESDEIQPFYDGYLMPHTGHKESHPSPVLPLKSRPSENLEQKSNLTDPKNVENINVKTKKNEASSRNASIAGHENIERHEQLSVNSLFNRVTYSSNVTSDTTTEGFVQHISSFIYGLIHAALFYIATSQSLSASTLESISQSKGSTNKEYDSFNDKYHDKKTFFELIFFLVSIILYVEGVFANFAFLGYVIHQRFPKITTWVEQRSTTSTTYMGQQYFYMEPRTTHAFQGKDVNSRFENTSNKYMTEPKQDTKQDGYSACATKDEGIIEFSRNLDIACKFQTKFLNQEDKHLCKIELARGDIHKDPNITQHPQSTSLKRRYKGIDYEDNEDISPVLPSTEEESEETFLKLIEGDHDDIDDVYMDGHLNNESDLRITARQDEQNLSKNELVFTDSMSRINAIDNTILVSVIDAEENMHCHKFYPNKLNSLDQSMSSDLSIQKDSAVHWSLESSLSSTNTACSKEPLSSEFASAQNRTKTARKTVNGANKLSILHRIETSQSVYKKCALTIYKHKQKNKLIAKQVRRFFHKQERKCQGKNRRILRRIRACSAFVKYNEPIRLICNPFFSWQLSSNQIQQEQVTQNNIAIQESHELSFQRSEQVNSIGTLASIFNSFSVESSIEDRRYHLEWMRLASFGGFESDEVHAVRLARNGWYSTGQQDQTVCFSCQRVHQHWNRNDDPDNFHDLNCSYINRRSNNIPIPREPSVARDGGISEEIQNTGDTFHRDHSTNNSRFPLSQGENVTTASLSAQNVASSSDSNSSSDSTLSAVPSTSDLRSSSNTSVPESTDEAAASLEDTKRAQLEALKRDPMGINFDRPKYPSYAILSERIKSFSDWPASMTQTPRDMALAGFFYAGYGDYTRCFFCGGGLRNWEAGDDPCVEHARWFSKCAFVRQNKGQGFIDQVLQRAAELERQENPTKEDDKKAKEEKVMQSEAVLCIKRMGYTDEIIRSAIDTMKTRLPRGKHKVSAQEILEVVFELFSSQQTVKEERDLNADVGSTEVPQTTGDDNSEMGASCLDTIQDDELTSLELENRNLKGQLMCMICTEKNVSIAFLPCGHLTCCEDCAPAMRKCPICREFVKGTVKTFLV